VADPLLSLARNHAWRNFHRNVALTVDRYYTTWNAYQDGTLASPVWKAGLLGLRTIVRLAESEGKRLRALGGTWSLSQAAVSSDFMVNTKPLNYVELGFRPSSVDASFSGNPQALVFAQCGASVMELNQYLEPRGFALPTSGASNGQTIAGAISTGTHGSANGVGSMQDFILGLHIVAEAGQTYWVERASRPVVSERFVRALGATRLADDELFQAALVSFGSFGLLHAVVFEADPLYLLEKYVRSVNHAQVLPLLGTLDVSRLGLEQGGVLPFHFEVVFNPYKANQGAFLRYMYKHASSGPGAPSGGGGIGAAPGEDLLGFLGGLTSEAPALIPLIVDQVLGSQLSPVSGVTRTPGGTFGPTNPQGEVMSSELGVALADAPSALDAVLTVSSHFPWPGIAAARFVKGSKASLAFTRFPTTCTIELPGAASSRTLEAYERIWDELERRKIKFTLHWGQILRYDPLRLRNAYGPARVNAWLRARRGFLGAGGRRTFANGLLINCGLAD
jgi:FAD binding domain